MFGGSCARDNSVGGSRQTFFLHLFQTVNVAVDVAGEGSATFAEVVAIRASHGGGGGFGFLSMAFPFFPHFGEKRRLEKGHSKREMTMRGGSLEVRRRWEAR